MKGVLEFVGRHFYKVTLCVLREGGSYSELLLQEATVLSKLNHESVCFMFRIQSDDSPYCLISIHR